MHIRNLQWKKVIIIISLVLLAPVIGYAINIANEGYQLTSGQVANITLADASCKKITNNATNRFIPTKTMAEWNSFNAVAGGLGVTIASCVISCPNGYYYISSIGACVSKLYGPTGYQAAWNTCINEGGTMLNNGSIRGATLSDLCGQSGNCGVLGSINTGGGKITWNYALGDTNYYNSYEVSICGYDGCTAHAGLFDINTYASNGFPAVWATGSDPADNSHYYFCMSGKCPSGMTYNSGDGKCYSGIRGPTTFYNAYNDCMTNFGANTLSEISPFAATIYPIWSNTIDPTSYVRYGCPNGGAACQPTVYPPPDQNAANSCPLVGISMNSFFGGQHSIRGCTGGYTGNAYYFCKK